MTIITASIGHPTAQPITGSAIAKYAMKALFKFKEDALKYPRIA